MPRTRLDLASYADPVGGWSTSLANVAEVMVPCIELAGARSVIEIGAYDGDLTRLLADWAAKVGGRVLAVDPAPKPGLVQLAEEREETELLRETSLEALPHVELAGRRDHRRGPQLLDGLRRAPAARRNAPKAPTSRY